MLQDDEGFMWFATDEGVSRFDGHHFSNFRKSDGIADDEIIRLGKDHEGRIWFLGFNGKASFYLLGKFYDEHNSAVAAQTHLSSALVKFMISKTGTVYLVSNTDGFLEVKENTVKKFSKDTLFKLAGFNFTNGLKCVKMDSSGALWLFDKQHIYIFKDGNPKTKIFSQSAFPVDMINSFFLADGSYVILSGGKLIHYYGNKSDTANGPLLNSWYDYLSVEEDHAGNLWLMTKTGAYLFRSKPTEIHQPVKLFDGTYCGHVFTDDEGNTWLSPLRNGVYMIPSLDVQFLNTASGLANNNVMVIADYSHGVIVGFSNGSVQRIQYQKQVLSVLPPLVVGSFLLNIIQDKDCNCVFLTTAEVVTCNKQLVEKKRIPINWAKSYLPLKDGSLLIGGGFRLSLLKNDQLTPVYTFPFENRIYAIAKKGADTIWLGTEEGLYCFYNSKMHFWGANFPELKNRINDLKIDPRGRLWVASSQNGILLYDKGKVTDMLPGDEKVAGFKFFVAPNEVLYAGTDKGIFIIKETAGNDFALTRIRKSDGLASEKINAVLLKDSMLWIGTDEGLQVLPLHQKLQHAAAVPIRLTAFTVNGESLDPSSSLNFNYQQNNIHLSFTGIGFREPQSVIYRYSIQPGDTGWHYTSNSSLDLPELSPHHYQLTIQAGMMGSHWSSSPLQLSFTIHAPFWKTAWFYGAILLSIAAAVFFIFRYRYRSRVKEEEQKRKSVEAELAALRSQMNPHFIFNSLNAIQDFIFQHQAEEANEYLSKFARLIRALLNQSRKKFATIEEECQLLTMYLELESLRFNHTFDWEVKTGKEIVADEMMIPSMLLQPVLENSIKHGFKNLKWKGLLKISFEKENDFIRCEIEDNGMGRPSAKNGDVNSLAMSITAERLSILNQSLHRQCTMEVMDLFDNGFPKGLRTIFLFPENISL